MDKLRSHIQQCLTEHGIKPSLQRIAVLEYLMTHATHPTVDTIFSDLYPSIPTLSKATVYNTLKLLVQCGAVNMITIDEKNARYDACTTPHMHFRCRECGAIIDIEQELPVTVDLPRGTVVESCQTYCYGVCAECNKQDITLH